jgi:hypothetical protein
MLARLCTIRTIQGSVVVGHVTSGYLICVRFCDLLLHCSNSVAEDVLSIMLRHILSFPE